MRAEPTINDPMIDDSVKMPFNRRWSISRASLKRLLPGLALAGSRGFTLAAQFATQIVVGMLAGASGLGVLQLFTSWVSIAGEILALGLPARAMRQVAVACAHGEVSSIERILRQSRQTILRLGSVVALLLLPALLWAGHSDSGPDWGVYYWLIMGTICTAPLFAIGRLYAESLKASGAALTAVTLENLLSPLVVLSLCAACWLLSEPLVALSLLVAFGASVVIVPVALRLAITAQLARLPAIPLRPSQIETPALTSAPHRDLFYLWSNGVLSIAFLQMPFLIMPLFLNTSEIGVYAMAHKLVNVITTLLLLLAAVYGPRFARSAAQLDIDGLAAQLRQTQFISMVVYSPAALLLIVFAAPLAELFGHEFSELGEFLIILCFGQLINAATGLCGVLLNMSGHASRELVALCVTGLVAIVTSAVVGPRYGAVGLAWVFSGSIALKNLISYGMVRGALKTMPGQA